MREPLTTQRAREIADVFDGWLAMQWAVRRLSPAAVEAIAEARDALRAQADEIEHHVEELEIRMADITRLSGELKELRAWVADMERRA